MLTQGVYFVQTMASEVILREAALSEISRRALRTSFSRAVKCGFTFGSCTRQRRRRLAW